LEVEEAAPGRRCKESLRQERPSLARTVGAGGGSFTRAREKREAHEKMEMGCVCGCGCWGQARR
jgi:uncharacterized protein YdaU (DUF1376 family)